MLSSLGKQKKTLQTIWCINLFLTGQKAKKSKIKTVTQWQLQCLARTHIRVHRRGLLAMSSLGRIGKAAPWDLLWKSTTPFFMPLSSRPNHFPTGCFQDVDGKVSTDGFRETNIQTIATVRWGRNLYWFYIRFQLLLIASLGQKYKLWNQI